MQERNEYLLKKGKRKMKITVLGMWGGFPKPGEATSGYLIQSETTSVLLDCGSGVLSQLLLRFPVNELDAIVLSHYHADHCCDIGVMQYARLVHQAMQGLCQPLPIYGFDNGIDFQRLTYHRESSITQGMSYQNQQAFQIGDLSFLPFRTLHAVECYGFRIQGPGKTICYTADGGFCPDQIIAAKDVDLLLSEANFSHEGLSLALGNHMTGTQVGQLAQEANVKQLVLTHLPPLKDSKPIYDEVVREYSRPTELAKPGLVITL